MVTSKYMHAVSVNPDRNFAAKRYQMRGNQIDAPPSLPWDLFNKVCSDFDNLVCN